MYMFPIYPYTLYLQNISIPGSIPSTRYALLEHPIRNYRPLPSKHSLPYFTSIAYFHCHIHRIRYGPQYQFQLVETTSQKVIVNVLAGSLNISKSAPHATCSSSSIQYFRAILLQTRNPTRFFSLSGWCIAKTIYLSICSCHFLFISGSVLISRIETIKWSRGTPVPIFALTAIKSGQDLFASWPPTM